MCFWMRTRTRAATTRTRPIYTAPSAKRRKTDAAPHKLKAALQERTTSAGGRAAVAKPIVAATKDPAKRSSPVKRSAPPETQRATPKASTPKPRTKPKASIAPPKKNQVGRPAGGVPQAKRPKGGPLPRTVLTGFDVIRVASGRARIPQEVLDAMALGYRRMNGRGSMRGASTAVPASEVALQGVKSEGKSARRSGQRHWAKKKPVQRLLSGDTMQNRTRNLDLDENRPAVELLYDDLSRRELAPLLVALGKSTGGDREEMAARLATAIRQSEALRKQKLREEAEERSEKFRRELVRLEAGQRAESGQPSTMQQRIQQKIRNDHVSYWQGSGAPAAVLPDDVGVVVTDASFENIASALDSIAVPVNTSRGNVKLNNEQVVTGMCIGVVGGRSNGIITSS